MKLHRLSVWWLSFGGEMIVFFEAIIGLFCFS